MKRVVWILSEGSPGHVSQSQGLVSALAKRIELDSTVLQTRPQINGFARDLVRLWMGACGKPLGGDLLKRWFMVEIPAGVPAPDLIVASGGKSVYAARSLALKFRVPLVFLGERKPFPSAWFHTVFTPSPLESAANDVQIEMIPTGITPEVADAAARAWQDRPAGKLWAMIIGGASASHRYTVEDWQALGKGMNQLALTHGIRWLVTTSRRTGAPAEAILRQHLDPRAIARAVWWAETPEKMVAAFLGSAEWVFVTQDSVTMVTEAVASGRPTVVTWPTGTTLKAAGLLHGYFKRLVVASRIIRLPIIGLAHFHADATRVQPRLCPINCELAAELIARLRWPTTA
jgi:mitochondrial fission protein ELM1